MENLVTFFYEHFVKNYLLGVIVSVWLASYVSSLFDKTLGRKILHMGMGVSVLYAEYAVPQDIFKLIVPCVSIIMTLVTIIKIFNFVRPKDINILTYIGTVAITVFMQIPLKYISPMFFADPMACLVGRSMTKIGLNVKLINSKSLLGSLTAMGIASYLLYPLYGNIAIFCGFILAVVELLVLNNDNLYIWMLLIVYHYGHYLISQ